MNDDLVERARRSDGFERFTASDGLPAFRADTTLINELADEVERLERVVEFAAAHGPETCPKHWPEGCARAVVSMAQRSIPDPTYSLADEEGKADECDRPGRSTAHQEEEAMTDHKAFNGIVEGGGEVWPPCQGCGRPDALVRIVRDLDANPEFYCARCAGEIVQ